MNSNFKDNIFTFIHTAVDSPYADLRLVVVKNSYHLGNRVGRVRIRHRADTGEDHFSGFDDVVIGQ